MAIMRTAARSDVPGPRREAVSTARRVLTSVERAVRCTHRDGRPEGGHAGSGDLVDPLVMIVSVRCKGLFS
jgi:hypothetical protein